MYYSTTNRAYVSRNPSVFNSIYLPNAPSAMSSLIQNSPPSLLPRLSRKPSIPGQRQRQLSAVSDDKPKGLANLRNTCYMNSVLQILFQILQIPVSLNTKAVSRAFMRLHDTHSYQDNTAFKTQIENRLDFVQGYQQQDSQEFLRGLLEVLNQQNSQIRSILGRPAQFKVNSKLNVRQNWYNFMSEMQKRDCSDIVFIFGGETVSTIRCNYGHKRYTFDRFMDLTVSFPSVDSCYNLSDLLKYEFRPESLDEVECQQCSAKVSSIKTTYLYNPPPYLVIHINRFRQGGTSNVKINTPISFDEIMDIPSQICHDDLKQQTRVRYQLMGVVSHQGTIDSGHYYCDMRGSNGQKWYQCNDEHITEASVRQQGNVSEYAYMLFYRRI